MAYMNDDLDFYPEIMGPYPNKVGEFCGNLHLDDHIKCRSYVISFRSLKDDIVWLAKMRFGRPRSGSMGTTEEMEARGFVGLYLKKLLPLLPGVVEIETPDELKEPDGPCPQWILNLEQER